MEKKIFFQKCGFNYIFFFFYFIALFIKLIIQNSIIYRTENELDDNDERKKYLYSGAFLMLIYLSNLSDFLSFIPYKIVSKLSKENKKENNNDENMNTTLRDRDTEDSRSLIYNNAHEMELEKKNKIIRPFCILVATFDFLAECINFVSYSIYGDLEFDLYYFKSSVIINILLQFLLSYLLLKMHFYKLHYFSIIIYVSVFVMLLILDIINIAEGIFNWQKFIFDTFNLIFMSLEYAFGKKVFLNGFLSPYELLIIKAIYKIFIVIALSILCIFIKNDAYSIILLLLSSVGNILLLLLYIIFQFLDRIFMWIIIDRFSLSYLPLAFIIEELCNYFIDTIFRYELNDDMKPWELVIRIILYVIATFGIIVHNEILIVNIFGLGSYTKYFLEIKLKNEELYSNTDNPDIISRYETFNEMTFMEDEDDDEDRDENKKTNVTKETPKDNSKENEK